MQCGRHRVMPLVAKPWAATLADDPAAMAACSINWPAELTAAPAVMGYDEKARRTGTGKRLNSVLGVCILSTANLFVHTCSVHSTMK